MRAWKTAACAGQIRLGMAWILHPSSEREILRWLRHHSALGELLGPPPGDLAADAPWRVEPRIVFYDLSNTFHTGWPGHECAAHGRPK